MYYIKFNKNHSERWNYLMVAITRDAQFVNESDYMFPMHKNLIGEIVLSIDIDLPVDIIGNQICINAMQTLLNKNISQATKVSDLLPAYTELTNQQMIEQGFFKTGL